VSTTEEIVGAEFRFGYHIPSNDPDVPDYHFIKEQVHIKQGDQIVIKPRMRLIKDFKRPVFFTRPNLRTHKEKKEVEKLENLIRVDVRQSDVKKTVARMLELRNGFTSLREMCASPYVYAADIPSTLFIRKHFYTDKYKDLNTPRTVAMFDTETDVIDGIGDIIMATVCYNNVAMVAVQERKVKGYVNVEEMFYQACKKHLKRYIEENNLEIRFHVVKAEIDILKVLFNYLHEQQPDFLAIWNMNFDIPKVLTACENANVDPKGILCDPKVPPHLRLCEYIEGATSQVTASGKHKPIRNANQWHTLKLTASFYVIDAMCVYRRLRGGAELPSYSLDAILSKELKDKDGKPITKLEIEEAKRFKKLQWHQFMQEKMIFDYMAYNIFDSYAMILLDLQTKDLSRTLPYFADQTSFEDYASQTKRLRDNFFVFAMENLNVALASLGPRTKEKKEVVKEFDDDSFIEGDPDLEESDEDDEENGDPEREYKTLDRRNWVVTLRSFMTVMGLPLLEEFPQIHTLIRAFVYDSDVVSSYPNCTLIANVSKITTRKELSTVVGVPEAVFRMQNLNLIFGATNHLEYCQTMLGFPTFQEMDKLIKNKLAHR
jgi:hypothetical protein